MSDGVVIIAVLLAATFVIQIVMLLALSKHMDDRMGDKEEVVDMLEKAVLQLQRSQRADSADICRIGDRLVDHEDEHLRIQREGE